MLSKKTDYLLSKEMLRKDASSIEFRSVLRVFRSNDRAHRTQIDLALIDNTYKSRCNAVVNPYHLLHWILSIPDSFHLYHQEQTQSFEKHLV